MKGMAYRQHEIVMRPGDELFLYTDGITEAANPEYKLFGNQRLLDAANSYFDLPIEGFVASIKGEVDKFAQGAEQADDITMLSLRYYGEKQEIQMESAMNELCIEAKLENLDTVINFVTENTQGCPPKTRNQICIAVDEIFSNIARYAYAPTTGGAVVRVAAGDEITIEFEDGGAAFDPLSKDDPDLSPSAEERQPGGLGIFMVKNLMDYVEYQRIGNKNVLTIKKNI
jgi:sigma-B regulation protein RsbU (phosphoserine phosphatase)